MKKHFIPTSEILKLYSNTIHNNNSLSEGISMHSLGQWLKVKTKDEFVVVPRAFVIALMNVVIVIKDRNLFQDIDDTCVFEKINSQWNLKQMKSWL